MAAGVLKHTLVVNLKKTLQFLYGAVTLTVLL